MKKERGGGGNLRPCPYTYFFDTPCSQGSEGEFLKNKCRPILTARKFACNCETPTNNYNKHWKSDRNERIFRRDATA